MVRKRKKAFFSHLLNSLITNVTCVCVFCSHFAQKNEKSATQNIDVNVMCVCAVNLICGLNTVNYRMWLNFFILF